MSRKAIVPYLGMIVQKLAVMYATEKQAIELKFHEEKIFQNPGLIFAFSHCWKLTPSKP